jgi:8-oxo-dGTP pyrophosphatase MutT (NUDIX family)
MGGRVDDESDMAVVAARELLEETAGTVKVDAAVVAQAPYVDCGIFHRYVAVACSFTRFENHGDHK